MPTYEYHCAACGATYDLRQSFSAEPTHVCEECGKGTAKRVLHAPPIVFKGSGWYVTDSRGKSPTLEAGPPAESAPAEGAATAPSSPGESSSAGNDSAAAAAS